MLWFLFFFFKVDPCKETAKDGARAHRLNDSMSVSDFTPCLRKFLKRELFLFMHFFSFTVNFPAGAKEFYHFI